MKYFSKLLLAALVIPCVLKAQSNFKTGYVVSLKGDTIKGVIDYREWDNNPTTFDFKSNGNPTITNYTTATTKAFGITGLEYFETYTLPISQEKVDVNLGLNKNVDTAAIIKTVFLRVLAQGSKVSLYSYTDDIKQRFYIKENLTGPIQELVYKAYYEENTLKTVKRYRLQLQYIAQQHNKTGIARQIADAAYTEPDLKKIANAINGNSSMPMEEKSGKHGAQVYFGLTGNYATLKFSGTGGPFVNGTKQSSFAPQVDLGLDIYANKNTQRLVLRLALSATTTNISFPPVSNPAFVNYLSSSPVISFEFKQVDIAVSPQIVYNFYNTDSFKWFIASGITMNFASYKNLFTVAYGNNVPDGHFQYGDFQKTYPSIPLTTGIKLNSKLEINVGYILPVTVSSTNFTNGTPDFNALLSSYHAGIKYFL